MVKGLVLTVLFSAAALAQTPSATAPVATTAAPHPLTAELQKSRLAVTLRDGTVSGPGGDLLLQELASTQFFLLGEEHASAEIARLATALLPPAWKNGYRHVAVETGPISTPYISTYETIEAHMRRYPWSLAFLSWKEEAEFHSTAIKLGGGSQSAIWPIDQEFILSPTMHLERLVALATTDEARAAATKLLERSRAGEAELYATRKPTGLLMLAATAEDFTALRAHFKDAEGLRIIDALEESRKIYALNMTSGWESNQKRSELMKRLFADAYATAVAKGEAKPKVFVKLGATHTMRGRSMTGVFDLGNMLPELAVANGTRSFQMLVLPLSGFTNTYRPFSESKDALRTAYDPTRMPFDAKPLYDAASASEWSLFDLRPLRTPLARGKLEPLEPRFRNVLWGFDAILIIPNVTPATYFDFLVQ